MRTSPVHYIAPTAISITPNANGSQRDMAVYVARGAKIKVYSPRAGIGTEDSTYQEWTISGRNRRLREYEEKTPYTIFARLSRTDKNDGYVVFAPKTKHEGVWIDKYSSVTPDGQSVLYTENGFDVRITSPDYWYVRLGDVILPEQEEGPYTVELDTGILDTAQYNVEWNLNPDALPLRIELGCTINDEDVGEDPYVFWGQSVVLTAMLTEGWTGTDIQRFDHWEIVRKADSGTAEPGDKWLGNDRNRAFSTSGEVTLEHSRDADDFCGAVATTFTVMAMEANPDYVDGSGLQPYLVLKSATITIMAETVESFELALSDAVVSFNPMNGKYIPENGVTVGIRATNQRGDVFDLTNAQVRTLKLSARYADVASTAWTAINFSGDGAARAAAVIPSASAFAAQKSVNVQLRRTVTEEVDGQQVVNTVELCTGTIAFVRDGEDSKVREWIYRLNSKVGYDGTTGTANGESVNGETDGIDNCLLVDDFVPFGWSDDPAGVSQPGDVEWESWRDYDDGNKRWGVFQEPVIHNRFAADAVIYDIVPSVSVINADAEGKVSTGAIDVEAYRTVGTVRSQLDMGVLAPTYYVVYSIDGAPWKSCAHWNEVIDGITVARYGVQADAVATVTDGIAFRLKHTNDAFAVLKEIPPVKVVRDGEAAHDVQPNILMRTVFDRGIDFVKEKWATAAGWDYVYIDTATDTVLQGRKSIRLDAMAYGQELGISQNVLGKIKPDTFYTVSFNAFHAEGGNLMVSFYNVIDGQRVRMIDEHPVVDGVETSVNEVGDIVVPAAWDGARHVVTFKTRSAQYLSTDTMNFQFWQGYSDNGQNPHSISCICMPKLEEGKVATAYMPHESDLVGEGKTGHAGRYYYYAGPYDENAIYRIEETQAPYVKYTDPDNQNLTGFFMLDNGGEELPYSKWPSDGHPARPSFDPEAETPWTQMQSEHQYYIAKAFFGDNANLGSFIINKDWMISQYGTYKPDANTTIIINGKNAAQYPAAYTHFNPEDPQAEGLTYPCFAPNFAVDGLTGATFQNTAVVRGEVHATSGDFQNVKISGGMRSPFTYIGPGSTLQTDLSDNVAIYSTSSDKDEPGTEYNIPWDASQSGRKIVIVNYKWGDSEQVSDGFVRLRAPSGQYFFEDGVMKASIQLSREAVELIGYGSSSSFYGWIVMSRVDICTQYKYGHKISALAYGKVIVENGAVTRASGTTFDGSVLNVGRLGEGKYKIVFGNTSWFDNTDHIHIMVSGYGNNSSRPLYASVHSIDQTGFEVWTGDDSTPNDGSFTFMVMNTADWQYLSIS